MRRRLGWVVRTTRTGMFQIHGACGLVFTTCQCPTDNWFCPGPQTIATPALPRTTQRYFHRPHQSSTPSASHSHFFDPWYFYLLAISLALELAVEVPGSGTASWKVVIGMFMEQGRTTKLPSVPSFGLSASRLGPCSKPWTARFDA
jgi:hypothetical protein